MVIIDDILVLLSRGKPDDDDDDRTTWQTGRAQRSWGQGARGLFSEPREERAELRRPTFAPGTGATDGTLELAADAKCRDRTGRNRDPTLRLEIRGRARRARTRVKGSKLRQLDALA